MKKNYWIYGLSGLVFIIVLLLILAPGVVKKHAVKHSKEMLGRQISVGKLKVNYFTSTIQVLDFNLYETNDKDVFVSFDTLLLNLAPLKLIRNEKVVERLFLKGMKVDIVLNDSLYNFSDLLEFHQSEPDTSTREPFQYILSNLEMAGANIRYTDTRLENPISMRDLHFFIPHIAWNQGDKSEAGLRFSFMREGYLEASLNIHPVEKEFDMDVAIHRLYFDPFADFLKNRLQLDSIGGVFNTGFTIEGDLDEISKAVVTGKFEILDLEITDNSREKLLGLERLYISAREMDLFNQNFTLDSIQLAQPYIYFELYDSTNNLSDFLNIQPSQEADSIQGDSTSLASFALNSFVIEGGIIDLTDLRTSEPFHYHLSELNLAADSISSEKDWIDLTSQMLLNNRGILNAEVGLNPKNPMDLKMDFVITDFLLSDLNIYSRHYTGSPIITGDMYYKSTTRIIDGEISSENKLIMEQVEIGDKQGGVHDLPLKFALFLLKDREGVIHLDVPVRGDLKDPEINLGKIVWTTFKNLIVKTVAAPYDLLADLLSVDPQDIEAIEFAYADTTLTDSRKKQLELLLSLEEKKEGLGIELIYFNDALREKEELFALSGALSDSTEVKTIGEDLGSFLAIDSLAIAFNEKRVSLVSDYLKSLNDSTTIVTSLSHPESPENLGSLPKFVVHYTMKEN